MKEIKNTNYGYTKNSEKGYDLFEHEFVAEFEKTLWRTCGWYPTVHELKEAVENLNNK